MKAHHYLEAERPAPKAEQMHNRAYWLAFARLVALPFAAVVVLAAVAVAYANGETF